MESTLHHGIMGHQITPIKNLLIFANFDLQKDSTE